MYDWLLSVKCVWCSWWSSHKLQRGLSCKRVVETKSFSSVYRPVKEHGENTLLSCHVTSHLIILKTFSRIEFLHTFIFVCIKKLTWRTLFTIIVNISQISTTQLIGVEIHMAWTFLFCLQERFCWQAKLCDFILNLEMALLRVLLFSSLVSWNYYYSLFLKRIINNPGQFVV